AGTDARRRRARRRLRAGQFHARVRTGRRRGRARRRHRRIPDDARSRDRRHAGAGVPRRRLCARQCGRAALPRPELRRGLLLRRYWGQTLSEQLRTEGIEGVDFKGPYAVGAYAKFLQGRMREVARVQVFGEVFNMRRGRGAKVYFELRDGDGALPCSMWRTDFEKLGAAADTIVDGAQIVVAGGPDYYPGSRTSSPSFSFQVTG